MQEKKEIAGKEHKREVKIKIEHDEEEIILWTRHTGHTGEERRSETFHGE